MKRSRRARLLFALIATATGFVAHRLQVEFVQFNQEHFMNTFFAPCYVPEQRLATGKWPTNLEELAAYAKKTKNEDEAHGLGYFESMRVTRIERSALLYTIHTKTRDYDCFATVNPEDGRCTGRQ